MRAAVLRYRVMAYVTGVVLIVLCFVGIPLQIAGHPEVANDVGVLHGMGCQFALDDFGSGVGSFSNLKSLPMDYLKIDGVYTHDVENDSVNREMVSAMVKLSRTLDFRVVAEQVEDQASFEALRGLGVDFVQGYVVERPRPLHSVH